MNEALPITIVGILAACAALVYLVSLIRRIRKRGGVAGVLVGADIKRTVDSVNADATGMTSGEMRVHRFSGGPDTPEVGLELMLCNVGSYQSMTAGLSARQARALASLIRRGIGETRGDADRRQQSRDGPV